MSRVLRMLVVPPERPVALPVVNRAEYVDGRDVPLRLLDIREVRVVSFLPALIVTPLFVGLADAMRAWWP